MQVDLQALKELEQLGLIRTQIHPSYPELRICNYTQEVQFKKLWTPLLKQCRGLVVNWETGELVARPFEKFFNLSEHPPKEIPYHLPYKILEKLDGSLSLLFHYRDEWIWATRGSFTSEQSQRAKVIFEETYLYGDLDKTVTYLFEVLYRENRIVVLYDRDRLVCLATIETETGEELEVPCFFEQPILFDQLRIEDLAEFHQPNFEGFVVRFENGFRVKVKLEEYLALHRLAFGLNSGRIWEALQESSFEDLLASLPEELLPWARKQAATLLRNFHREMSSCYQDFLKLTVESDRKQTALNYQTYGYKPYSARFALLDGKSAEKHIWHHIKPEYESFK